MARPITVKALRMATVGTWFPHSSKNFTEKREEEWRSWEMGRHAVKYCPLDTTWLLNIGIHGRSHCLHKTEPVESSSME